MLSYHTSNDVRSAVRGWRQTFSTSVITTNIWSGITWSGGHRREQNFLFSDYCVLDFDSGELSLAAAVRSFCDANHIIGTTRSHQRSKADTQPCDRFRVAIPWERRITDIKTYRFNMFKLTEKYPVDPKCIDGARLFFPCTCVVSSSSEGFRQEVREPPDSWGVIAAPPPGFADAGRLPPHLRRWLDAPAAQGSIRQSYFKIGAELSKYGFPLPDAIDLVRRGRVGDNATSPRKYEELADCVASGWRKDSFSRRN